LRSRFARRRGTTDISVRRLTTLTAPTVDGVNFGTASPAPLATTTVKDVYGNTTHQRGVYRHVHGACRGGHEHVDGNDQQRGHRERPHYDHDADAVKNRTTASRFG
jgi:hypothetical protein